MGRKALAGIPKDGRLVLRLTASERTELDTAAAAAGVPETSRWIRDLALSVARSAATKPATPAKKSRTKPAK